MFTCSDGGIIIPGFQVRPNAFDRPGDAGALLVLPHQKGVTANEPLGWALRMPPTAAQAVPEVHLPVLAEGSV
jgi:hypothetical protein